MDGATLTPLSVSDVTTRSMLSDGTGPPCILALCCPAQEACLSPTFPKVQSSEEGDGK